MNASTAIKKFGLEQAFNYLYKDPKENLVKLMDWADKFAGGEFETQRKLIREAITDPKHPYYPFIQRLLTDIDPEVMKTIAVNFFINASLVGWPKQEECRKKYGCNIPWAILLVGSRRMAHGILLQYSMGHSSGPHQCLQPPLHRLLGR